MLFTLTVLVLPGCDQSHGGSHQEQLPPAVVVVSQPVEKSVIDYVDYTGRTDAAESVEIRARVTGFLNAVLFKDGVEVEKGAPLFEIDDREYQADLDSARAELASAKAHQEKATTDFKRMETLKQKGAASAEEYDRADASKKEADAAVEAGVAKQASAQLKVDFSKIAAPIAGKISRSQTTQGNLINADTTVLTTIVSVEPMYVYFDVDERTILTIRKQVREGQLAGRRDQEIPVFMGLTIDKETIRTWGRSTFSKIAWIPARGPCVCAERSKIRVLKRESEFWMRECSRGFEFRSAIQEARFSSRKGRSAPTRGRSFCTSSTTRTKSSFVPCSSAPFTTDCGRSWRD